MPEAIHPEKFAARRAAFRKLHASGCFVIPNPWDPGTARYLAHLGFPALATTSAGFAFSQGLPDAASALSPDHVLRHISEIVNAVDLPVNADFQSGYGRDPEAVAKNVERCVATGVAGLSIEDATGDRDKPLYDLEAAVDRIRAARAAIDRSGADVLLTGRAECFLTGHPDPLRESIRRLKAYSEAGADVLYAPGVHEPDAIREVVAAVAPKPINVLMGPTGLKIADLAALGVRRVSIGGTLARIAWTAFMHAADELSSQGTMESAKGAASHTEFDRLFSRYVETK